MNENMICETIKILRNKKCISQDILAQALDISVQAISKWETGNSLPDILQLPKIAHFFGITIDTLFYGISYTQPNNLGENISEIKDDGKLRIVQFLGNKCLRSEEWLKDKPITLHIDAISNEISMEIWGGANINGDLNGYIEAGGNVNCADVNDGYIEAGGSVNCGNVNGGYIEAGEGVNCGNVGGYIETSGGVNSGNVGGYIEAGGGVKCGNVHGNVNCGGDVKCNSIKGEVHVGQ